MPRLFALTIGLCLTCTALLVTSARAGSDGAYWLISPYSTYNSGGMYIQRPDEGQRHMMHGFDLSMSFMWWSDEWLYFRTIEAFNADFYSMYLHRVRAGGRRGECVGRKLALLGADPLSGFTPAPHSDQVAFSTPEGEPNRVYVSRSGCADPTRVFDGDSEVVNSLFWSLDGEWLYIHTHHESEPTLRLHRVRPDGSGLTFLTDIHAQRYRTDRTWQWSPDGERILLRACGFIDADFYILCSLHTISADGGMQAQLGDDMRLLGPVIWSDDGQWVIVADEGERPNIFEIFRIRADGSIREHISQVEGNVALHGTTPDGQWILFNTREDARQLLVAMHPDGSHQQRLFAATQPDRDISVEAFADGWIYFAEINPASSADTRLLRARPNDPDNVQPIAEGSFARRRWFVSPDGQSLLTIEGDSSGAAVHRVSLDGRQQDYTPLNTFYQPEAVSPLINVQWRGGFVLLAALLMLTLATGFRAILTKVPKLFGINSRLK